MKEVLTETGRMKDVVAQATSYQSIRMAEVWLKYFEKPREWKTKVMWYWGVTGSGKSYAAHKQSEHPYICLETNQWWEGYDAHEHVIIDDMRKNFCTYSRLLNLLDEYGCVVECKGGSRQLLAKQIIITSCYHPAEMYDTREDIEQLLRRIDKIEHFTTTWREKKEKLELLENSIEYADYRIKK